MPSPRAVLPALGALALLACACESRVEEPTPPPRPSARAAPTAAASPGPRGGAACVRPTPSAPPRAVSGPVPAPGCPADPGPVPTLPRGKVRFADAASAPTIDVEIAETDEHRQRGLMYRTSLSDAEGMLFVFERSRKLSFWMRNTCIPLDMIFVAEDGTIVHIEENTPTLTDQTFPSGCPAKYVVEVNAGWTRARGVVAGQKLAIER